MRLRLNSKIQKIILVIFTIITYTKCAAGQEITAIDFNGDIIGKVIPDGKVVSLDNRLIGNITADSLIINSKGKLIGGVVPRGIAVGNDNRILGKVSNDGTVRLATGKIVGKVLPNGLVVDDKFDILGSVLFPGLIYSDNGQTVGRLTGEGLYTNLQGQSIGFISPDGYAYRHSEKDYTLDGRLISSKMVINPTGHFIGSLSPGGKVTDFEGKQIGFIKANGFAYNSDNKVIGSIVRSGYAFDVTGKYIGLVTFNGEVINNEKLIGYLQADGTIADTEGSIIGSMVDISATASDAAGKYIGRIMPEGKIARGRDIIGKIGPRNVIYDNDGKQIGKIISSGPIFDYRGELQAHALKNGQVITPDGAPLGIIRNDFAVNNSGNIIGTTLNNKIIISNANKVLGITGINSKLSLENNNYTVSPFGYVYNSEGAISAHTVPLGQIYNLGGITIGTISPNGDIKYKGAAQGGQITQYGYDIDENNSILGGNVDVNYAITSVGNNSGIIANGNQVLDSSFKKLGKILPDNTIIAWSTKESYMPVNGKGNPVQLAVGFDGSYLGIIDNQGRIIDNNAANIGKVGSEGIIFDNSGILIGEPIGFMTAIDGKCNQIGVLTPTGEIKNYREVNMGKVLTNRQVVSSKGDVVGFGVEKGIVIDFGGRSIGTVTSDGKVLNFAGENLGCLDTRNRIYNKQKALIGKVISIAPVIDFNGKIIGRSMLDGKVVGPNNQHIGYLMPDDSVNSKTSAYLGMLFKYRYAFDNSNKLLGTINNRGEVIDNKGQLVGNTDFDGNIIHDAQKIGYALYDLYIYDNRDNAIGYITPNGIIMSFTNQRLGQLVRGFAVDSQRAFARGNRDFHIRDDEKKVIGELLFNGDVISHTGEKIGSLGSAGKILNDTGKIIATATPLQYYEVEIRTPVYDANGNIMGYIGENNQIVDLNGDVIGQSDQNGSVIGKDGTVIGGTKVDWYHKAEPNPTLPEVGSLKVKEGNYKRSVNIAITPDGEYLGDILEDGRVINKEGKVLGRVLPDGLVVDDQGTLIGIEESAKTEEKGDVFVPAGTFGDGGAYGVGTGPNDLGPGGGYGPGERYDPQRAAALQVAQGERRKGMAVGKISTGFSYEVFEGKQKDWGLAKEISTLPVDMDKMILADKPIPAVIARSIYTGGPSEVPVTAFVERNVYAEDGRNIVIPAGSRLIGSYSKDDNDGTNNDSARLGLKWERIVLPNGIMFKMNSDQTGDAQGRAGVLGYLDRQLVKKYSMPLITSLVTNGVGILFSTDDDAEGENSTETSKQQAMNDAREGFLNDTKQMFQNILNERMNIKPTIFIPVGTRIIVYPKVDLWLRTTDNAAEATANLEKTEDILIDDAEAIAYNKSIEERRSNPQRTVAYSPEESDVEEATVLIDDTAPTQKQRRSVGATPPPPPPPNTGVVNGNTNTNSRPSGGSSSDTSDVPQLF